MYYLTSQQRKLLLLNGTAENRNQDSPPVALLSIPAIQGHFLISKITDDKSPLVFGLLEFSDGKPHVGFFLLDDLIALGEKCEIENDEFFDPKFPLSVYIDAAEARRGISINEHFLQGYSNTSASEKKYLAVMVDLAHTGPVIRHHGLIKLATQPQKNS
jgi:hypothetical protein